MKKIVAGTTNRRRDLSSAMNSGLAASASHSPGVICRCCTEPGVVYGSAAPSNRGRPTGLLLVGPAGDFADGGALEDAQAEHGAFHPGRADPDADVFQDHVFGETRDVLEL